MGLRKCLHHKQGVLDQTCLPGSIICSCLSHDGVMTAVRAGHRSPEGAVHLMCQELMKAGRLFPPSEAMCQIQACSLVHC